MKLYELVPRLEGRSAVKMELSSRELPKPKHGPVKKHPADPTPRSPAQVLQDSAYLEQPHDPSYSTYPLSSQVIVKHKATGTLWACSYAVRKDDTDFEDPASWHRVKAVTKTITTYKAIR